MRLPDDLLRIGALLAGSLLICMMLMIAGDVALREFAGTSMLVASEMAGYMMVAVTFLSAGYSLRTGSFIRVTALLDRMPRVMRLFVQLLYDFLSLVYGLALGYFALQLALDSHARGIHSAQVSGTPLYIPQVAMVVGIGLLILAMLVEIGGGVARIVYEFVGIKSENAVSQALRDDTAPRDPLGQRAIQ